AGGQQGAFRQLGQHWLILRRSSLVCGHRCDGPSDERPRSSLVPGALRRQGLGSRRQRCRTEQRRGFFCKVDAVEVSTRCQASSPLPLCPVIVLSLVSSSPSNIGIED
uniref:Uncharacterized protein n=1 Tax=Triticum urartu TaxID=4572 RepID=A0A8R7QHE5_TRIUA